MTEGQSISMSSPTTVAHGLEELDVSGFDWDGDDKSISSEIWDHDHDRTDGCPHNTASPTLSTADCPQQAMHVPLKITTALPPSLSLVLLQARACNGSAARAKCIAQRSRPSRIVYRSIAPDETLLHRACRRKDITLNEIDQILRLCPHVASTRTLLSGTKLSFDRVLRKRVWKYIPETYTLPLNLAISHGVSSQVLQMLIAAAPSVLLMEDGRMKESPVAVLLKHRPDDIDCLETMLRLRPTCAYVRDRIQNTALHVACTRGVPMRVVQQLWRAAPETLQAQNRHGRTPLDLARIYTSICPEKVTDFLAESMNNVLDVEGRYVQFNLE